MKKRWLIPFLLILSAAVLVGCTSSADTMPSASPSATTSVAPTASPTATVTALPSASPAANGVTTIEDAKTVAEDIDAEVEKLSEISEAWVVVANNMALVGVAYDTEYQGGITTRLTDMIDARVTAVNKAITVVHVTDDEKLVEQIKKLQEAVEKGEVTFSELQTQALEISSSIAGAGPSASPSTSSSPAVGTGV